MTCFRAIAAAAQQLGFGEQMSYTGTGGGALREYMEGKELSGVAAPVSAPVPASPPRTRHPVTNDGPGPERERGARHGAGPGHQPARGSGQGRGLFYLLMLRTDVLTLRSSGWRASLTRCRLGSRL